jgi:hypothetical protein
MSLLFRQAVQFHLRVVQGCYIGLISHQHGLSVVRVILKFALAATLNCTKTWQGGKAISLNWHGFQEDITNRRKLQE